MVIFCSFARMLRSPGEELGLECKKGSMGEWRGFKHDLLFTMFSYYIPDGLWKASYPGVYKSSLV